MAKVESRLPYFSSSKPRSFGDGGTKFIISEHETKFCELNSKAKGVDTTKKTNGFKSSGANKEDLKFTPETVKNSITPKMSGLKKPNTSYLLTQPKGSAQLGVRQPVIQQDQNPKIGRSIPELSTSSKNVKPTVIPEKTHSNSTISLNKTPIIPPKPTSLTLKRTKPLIAPKTPPSQYDDVTSPLTQVKQPSTTNPQLTSQDSPLKSKLARPAASPSKPKLSQSPNSLPKSSTIQVQPSRKDGTSTSSENNNGSNDVEQFKSPINKSTTRFPSKLTSPSTKTSRTLGTGLQTNISSALEKPKKPHVTSNVPKSRTFTKIGECAPKGSHLRKSGSQSPLTSSPKTLSSLPKSSSISSPVLADINVSCKVQQCNTETLFTPLNQVQSSTDTLDIHSVSPVRLHTPHTSCGYQLHYVASEADVISTRTSLNTVTSLKSIQLSTAECSLEEAVRLDSHLVNKVQSFCGPSITNSSSTDEDEVFETGSLIANVQVSHCYSYLQQAAHSSFRKQLINSFAVKEQLSPTAESHARHVANSMPQPWLSADIIKQDNNDASVRELIIPEPPTECEKTKSKLQVIAEDVETTGNSLPNTNQIIEPENNRTSEKHKLLDSKLTPKTPNVLGNMFSKIGGRRILTRPQESPPRARKGINLPTGKGDRRKLSPKARRRDTNHIRYITVYFYVL